LGTVGYTTVAGVDPSGTTLPVGEDIYGPFEAGFTSTQNNILEALGCADGNDGHVVGGIDTFMAEQMVAHQCGITLPRFDGANYVSLLDQCGGHTREYHFHERLSCLFSASGVHSTQVGKAPDGTPLYGKWEDADNQVLPQLDACGGHFGVTPDSNGEEVYHYHVQDAAPFTFGCFGPNDDNTLVSVQQCRDFYSGCDGDLSKLTTAAGTVDYDLWCPCFDANGSNSGVNIAELAVFSTATDDAPAATEPSAATEPPAVTDAPAAATDVPSVTDCTGFGSTWGPGIAPPPVGCSPPAPTARPTHPPTTTVTTQAVTDPDTACAVFDGKRACGKNSCWFNNKTKTCHAAKDCSVATGRGYCRKIKCSWNKKSKVCA
jgi:hypothetical protein